MFLTTNYFFCEQIANFWVFFDFYSLFQFLANPYFMGYLPQHCLYFFPLPHARPLTIFCLYMVQIVLCVFPLFYGHLVHYIISIIYIINITNFICYVDKSWTKIILSQQFVYLHSLYTKFKKYTMLDNHFNELCIDFEFLCDDPLNKLDTTGSHSNPQILHLVLIFECLPVYSPIISISGFMFFNSFIKQSF